MSFFDSFKSNVKKTLGIAKDKSRDALELINLKADHLKLAQKRTRLINELGEYVYYQYFDGEADTQGIMKRCREIETLEDELSSVEERIKHLIKNSTRIESLQVNGHEEENQQTPEYTDNIICSCGSIVPPGSRFCVKCGKNIEDIVKETGNSQEKLNQVNICSNCGETNEIENLFCFRCGNKLKGVD